MHAYEVYAHEVYACEVHAYEMHAYIVNILIAEEVLAGCGVRCAPCGCCAPQTRRLQERQRGRDGDEDRRFKKQIMLTDSMIG